MTSQAINVPHLTFPGMSQAVRRGDVVVVSGQVALGPDGLVGDGDAAAQAAQCFANLRAVLEAAGSSLASVARLTCFLTDAADYPAYAAAKAAALDGAEPGGTCVVVSALLDPRMLIEIEAIAFADDAAE